MKNAVATADRLPRLVGLAAIRRHKREERLPARAGERDVVIGRRRIRHRIVWALMAWVAFRALWVLAFRFRVRFVIDAVRAFNKHLLNPAMMKLAGRRHWYAAVIQHKGRRSGKEYATPVWAEPTEDGFVVPLPYGEEVDWLRNVLKAGKCTIEAKGVSYPVGELEVVEASEVEPVLPSWPRFLFKLYGVRSYLKARTLDEASRATAPRNEPTATAQRT